LTGDTNFAMGVKLWAFVPRWGARQSRECVWANTLGEGC